MHHLASNIDYLPLFSGRQSFDIIEALMWKKLSYFVELILSFCYEFLSGAFVTRNFSV